MTLRFFQLLVLITLCSTAFGAFACIGSYNNGRYLVNAADRWDYDGCTADANQLDQVVPNTDFYCTITGYAFTAYYELYSDDCADDAERLQSAVGNGVNFFCSGGYVLLQDCDINVVYLNNVLNSQTASPTTSAPITSAPTTVSPTTASPTTSFPTNTPTQSPSASPTTPFPTNTPTQSPSASPTTSFPTISPTTSSSTTSPNRSQTTTQSTILSTTSPNRSQTIAQSTIPSTIQPTTSDAPTTSAESDQQQTTPSDDGIDVKTIVIIVLGIIVIIGAAVVWRLRSSHTPSKTNHQQPPVTENPTFTPESTAPDDYEVAVTLNPQYDQTAAVPERTYSEISPDYEHQNQKYAQLEPSHQLYERKYASLAPSHQVYGNNSGVYDQAVEMSSQA